MIDFIKVIILSIVEGITEFLPISSTGHMILVNKFVNLKPVEFSNSFFVIIQLGAILAVVSIYFDKLNPFSLKKLDKGDFPEKLKSMKKKRFINKTYYFMKHNKTMDLWFKIIFAAIPSAVLGLLFDDKIDSVLFKPMPVAFALLIYGVIIILMENKNKNRKDFRVNNVFNITYKDAFIIGMFQVLALVPGTSRSAATIIGAMIVGLNRTSSADFSFFLAIPTMFGATLLKILKSPSLGFGQWFLIFVGFIFSFIVAYLVIKKFLDYIKGHDFKVFGYYRIALSLCIILYYLILR